MNRGEVMQKIRTFKSSLQEFKVAIDVSDDSHYYLSIYYRDIYSKSFNFKEYVGFNGWYKSEDELDLALEKFIKKHKLEEVKK